MDKRKKRDEIMSFSLAALSLVGERLAAASDLETIEELGTSLLFIGRLAIHLMASHQGDTSGRTTRRAARRARDRYEAGPDAPR